MVLPGSVVCIHGKIEYFIFLVKTVHILHVCVYVCYNVVKFSQYIWCPVFWWQFGLVVTSLGTSMKLLYVEPG